MNVYLDPSHTPPPHFVVQAFSAGDSTPVDCSTAHAGGGSTCTVTTCPLPYPSCYVETQWIANIGTVPVNVVGTAEMTEPGSAYVANDVNNWLSVPPAIIDDDDIRLGPQIPIVISSPNATPPPIMVGNEVKLEASPAAALTSVQWNFDSDLTSDVISAYALVGSPTASPSPGPVSVASPVPVSTGANPTKLYWLTGDLSTWQSGGVPYAKQVNLVAYAANVQGPLSTDVYYPVASPNAWSRIAWRNVNIYHDYSPSGSQQCPGLFTVISVGDTCGTSPSGTNSPQPGMEWRYRVQVPSYGSGNIAMAQLVYAQDSGTYANCIGNCAFSDGGPPYGLDAVFPYDVAVRTGVDWYSNDSPAFEVAKAAATQCASAAFGEHFQDFFLYQPDVPTGRQGTPIWVSTFNVSWNFSGTASAPFISLSSQTNPNPSAVTSTVLPTWTALSPTQYSECIPPQLP